MQGRGRKLITNMIIVLIHMKKPASRDSEFHIYLWDQGHLHGRPILMDWWRFFGGAGEGVFSEGSGSGSDSDPGSSSPLASQARKETKLLTTKVTSAIASSSIDSFNGSWVLIHHPRDTITRYSLSFLPLGILPQFLNVAVLVTVGTFFVVYSSIDPINATQLSSPTMSCNI